ncbi:hypothetical protein BC831DRAFT_26076 [Entophlyctis helioformis]|nr:hypothetical protein BC831DRAFT_26076 [Entophlyctis helioformis]
MRTGPIDLPDAICAVSWSSTPRSLSFPRCPRLIHRCAMYFATRPLKSCRQARIGSACPSASTLPATTSVCPSSCSLVLLKAVRRSVSSRDAPTSVSTAHSSCNAPTTKSNNRSRCSVCSHSTRRTYSDRNAHAALLVTLPAP